MPTPSLSTTYILALISTVVGLALTQSLITNSTAQLITGLAAAFVPVILALAHSIFHAHVEAAKIGATKTSRSHAAAAVPPAK